MAGTKGTKSTKDTSNKEEKNKKTDKSDKSEKVDTTNKKLTQDSIAIKTPLSVSAMKKWVIEYLKELSEKDNYKKYCNIISHKKASEDNKTQEDADENIKTENKKVINGAHFALTIFTEELLKLIINDLKSVVSQDKANANIITIKKENILSVIDKNNVLSYIFGNLKNNTNISAGKFISKNEIETIFAQNMGISESKLTLESGSYKFLCYLLENISKNIIKNATVMTHYAKKNSYDYKVIEYCVNMIFDAESTKFDFLNGLNLRFETARNDIKNYKESKKKKSEVDEGKTGGKKVDGKKADAKKTDEKKPATTKKTADKKEQPTKPPGKRTKQETKPDNKSDNKPDNKPDNKQDKESSSESSSSESSDSSDSSESSSSDSD